MYNIYIIGQPISSLTYRVTVVDIVDARPSPPHFYYITDRLLFLYIFNTIVRLSIVSIFIHVYFLVKPLENIF